MIHGIGTDIVHVARLEASIARYGDRIAERILAKSELIAFQQHKTPAHFLAKRYAAKEAASKALGTGFRDGLSLRHIMVANEESGRPVLKFVEKAQKLVAEFNISASYLSLSDEQEYAVAFVVMEKAT